MTSMFRFTIRDVLWLTVVVAIALAWWISDSRLRAERDSYHSHAATLEERAQQSEGRASVLAKAMRDFGIPVEFDGNGIAIGPVDSVPANAPNSN